MTLDAIDGFDTWWDSIQGQTMIIKGLKNILKVLLETVHLILIPKSI